jgi:hypothetical protein
MTKLQKPVLPDASALDPARYFESLMETALSIGLLTGKDAEDIGVQTMELLRLQAERFTNGESGSLRTETAEKLLASIVYAIGLYFKGLPDPDAALHALRTRQVAELHAEGTRLVRRKVRTATHLLKIVQVSGFVTANQAYNDTVQAGLPLFFREYDPEFAAHQTPGSIDYPLSQDLSHLNGVEYILRYLALLEAETRFCLRWPAEDVHRLMLGHDLRYKDLLVNIFEHVCANAIASALCGNGARSLDIAPADRERLAALLAGLPDDALRRALADAGQRLCIEMDMPGLQAVVLRCAGSLPVRIKAALALKRLDTVFPGFAEPSPVPPVRFEDGERLDDVTFRRLADEIRECRYTQDKLAIIKREVRSIADLADLLAGGCLFGSEYGAVLSTLDDPALALLRARMPSIIGSVDLREWESALLKHIAGLPVERQSRIAELAEALEP